MPKYKVSQRPDIITTYLRGSIRHRPEFLRPTIILFEPVITVTSDGTVTIEDPYPYTVNSDNALIIQKLTGYVSAGVWNSSITGYVPVKPAELAQFRFRIQDQSRQRRDIFDGEVSIALFAGEHNEISWPRGEYLVVPGSTIEVTWRGPGVLTNFAGTGERGADIRMGVAIQGVVISTEVMYALEEP